MVSKTYRAFNFFHGPPAQALFVIGKNWEVRSGRLRYSKKKQDTAKRVYVSQSTHMRPTISYTYMYMECIIYVQGRIEHPRPPHMSRLVWGWILQFFNILHHLHHYIFTLTFTPF